jgi:beta-glucosidase-like glycosyl hydrolase/CubicO group peptidase (beta-lactamase class C family)
MKYKYIFFLFLITICTTTLFGQAKMTIPDLYKSANQDSMKMWVDSVYNSLSTDQRIGQLFTIITMGNQTNKSQIVSLVEKQHVGGIIFLRGTPENQAYLTNSAQSSAKVPLMISIDGEWGLAMRLANTIQFPRNMMLGAIQNDSLLYYYGQEVARQCRVMGIQINYAPDMDVNSNAANPVIGNRAYGEDPDLVARKGIMYSKGMESGKVMAVSKHFPGHGDTSSDSHHTLPTINHNRARLDSIEIAPFKKYIEAGLSGLMVGHLYVPALDAEKGPSSLSRKITTDLLKDELGFTGLVFTDGLAMKGVSEESNHCVKALLAGNDILLGPISPVSQFEAVKKAVKDGVISEALLEEKCRKVLSYKYILGLNQYKPINTENLLTQLNTAYGTWLCRKLNEKAITLLKNNEDIVPLKKLDTRKIAAISVGSSTDNAFHNTLRRYGDITCFNVADGAGLLNLKKQLEPFNTLIISVHTNKANANAAIQSVSKGKETVLSFFIVPYRMASYATSINQADGIIAAYEDTDYAQEFAAQGIFGGNAIEGRVPVSVKGLFKAGDGIDTKKVRLSYNLPEEIGLDSRWFATIDSIVYEGIDGKAFPGAQVLVAKDGVIIYDKAFGSYEYDGKKKVDTEVIYDLASMTKAVATLPAIMKLYDQQKFSLNTPVSQFIPLFKGSDKTKITIRDALFHESRLVSFFPYYMKAIDTDSYQGKLFNRSQTSLYKAQFDKTTYARTDFKYKPEFISAKPKQGYLQIADDIYVNKTYKDTIIASIADSKLRARKAYLYSCLNFMLLKEVVEDISKTDLDSYLQKNFYHRLGANTMTYNPLTKFPKDRIAPTERDDFLRKQLVQGYVHDEGAAFMGGIGGNAGLFADANDVAKLCQMYLNLGIYGDERYLSEQTCKTFTRTKSSLSRRGLGFDKPEMRTNKSSPCGPSTPASTYGHTGFTGTCFWVDPDNNLIYIFLSNRIYPKRSHTELMGLGIRPRIQEVIYGAIKKSKGEPITQDTDEEV